MHTKNNNKNKGFTLIELMTVVVIIGVLAAIAYPSYINSMTKARRADAEAALLKLANFMERNYTESSSYKPADLVLPFNRSPETGTKYYDLSLSANTATAYTLQAEPVAGSSQAKDSCGTLMLNSVGVKTPSSCW